MTRKPPSVIGSARDRDISDRTASVAMTPRFVARVSSNPTWPDGSRVTPPISDRNSWRCVSRQAGPIQTITGRARGQVPCAAG